MTGALPHRGAQDPLGDVMTGTRTTTAAALLAIALAAGCGGSDDTVGTATSGPTTSAPVASDPATSPATTAPTSSPSPGHPIALSGLPVYWVADSRGAFRLYREFRDVPDAGGPIASAVAAMTRMKPLDPDYSTPWKPASRVSVRQSGDALTVDLSADAVSGTQVGSELAELAVQQLVYTATAAAQRAGTPVTTVRILIDGKARDAWGAVHLGDPERRAPLADVQAQAWVTSPQQGETRAAGTIAFTGFGTSFEATFAWKVVSSAGTVVAHGSAMGGTGDGKYGVVRWTAQLSPGTYTVELATDDASGQGRFAKDDKRFTVR